MERTLATRAGGAGRELKAVLSDWHVARPRNRVALLSERLAEEEDV